MNRSILIVDDDPDTCASFADVLADCGYDVDVACDGPEALHLTREKSYRLALLDFRMPGMSGVELFERMRCDGNGTVAFLVTALASFDTVATAETAGIRDVFHKPVDLSELLPRVDEVMAARN